MHRYQRIEDGKLVGEIIYDADERSEHVIRKTGAYPITTVDEAPANPEYYVKHAPVYEVGDLEIREIYTYEPHPNLKEMRKEEIGSLRDKKLDDGIIFNEHRYDSDDKAQLRITGTILALTMQQSTDAVGWVTKDNESVLLTLAELIALGSAVATHVSTCVMLAKQHRDAIDSLDDPAAIIAYDIKKGWPE